MLSSKNKQNFIKNQEYYCYNSNLHKISIFTADISFKSPTFTATAIKKASLTTPFKIEYSVKLNSILPLSLLRNPKSYKHKAVRT